MAFNENTKFAITLATLFGLIVTVVTGSLTVFNHNEKNYLETKEMIRDNSEAIKDMVQSEVQRTEIINERLSSIESKHWSLNQEAENAARNAIANPGIRYADPKNPGHFFYVEPLNANR